MREVGIDAPFGAEGGDSRVVAAPVARVTVGRMIFGEQLRDVETDTASADDRHPFARALASLDDFDIARDLGMIDARNRRYAWHNAGGENHVVERAQVLRPDASIQLHPSAKLLEPCTKIAQGLGKLLLARNAPGQIELSADFGGRFEHRQVLHATAR